MMDSEVRHEIVSEYPEYFQDQFFPARPEAIPREQLKDRLGNVTGADRVELQYLPLGGSLRPHAESRVQLCLWIAAQTGKLKRDMPKERRVVSGIAPKQAAWLLDQSV
jgi:hypothetical protein